MRTPGRIVAVRPDEQPRSTTTGAAIAGKCGLQRVVRVAHVRVGENQHALGERHLRLELDALGQVEQALVAEEALVARSRSPASPRR